MFSGEQNWRTCCSLLLFRINVNHKVFFSYLASIGENCKRRFVYMFPLLLYRIIFLCSSSPFVHRRSTCCSPLMPHDSLVEQKNSAPAEWKKTHKILLWMTTGGPAYKNPKAACSFVGGVSLSQGMLSLPPPSEPIWTYSVSEFQPRLREKTNCSCRS